MTTSTTFAQLGVPSFIADALERRGITEPFEIQAATIADALAGRDVLGRAPTGSGKTLAFGVPLVAVTERARPGLPTALVLAPTRELAEQITTELRSFSGRLRVDAVYGGVGYGKQLNALRRGVDVLVACPGRLEDLIERGDVALSEVRCVVLDEADRMADMGFMPAVRRLLDQTPTDRQTVLFSATLDGDVAKVTAQYQRDPVRHEVGEETPDIRAAEHRFWLVERNERNALVGKVIDAAWPSIVFTRTRHGADRVAKQLGKLGYEAASIHGGLSQNARNRALDRFAKNQIHALIATDVAARGIHVDGVASVVHYDPPEDDKAYVHRSGRTARAGADGLVVSLVQPEQRKATRQLIRQVGLDAEVTDVEHADVHEHVPGGAQAGERELAATPRETTERPASGRGGAGKQHAGKSGQRHRSRNHKSGHKNGDRRRSTSDDPRRSGSDRSDDRRDRRPADRSDDRRDSRSSERSSGNSGHGATRSRQPNRQARRAHLQPKSR
jgi:superfamily II DNA/RNA helicase